MPVLAFDMTMTDPDSQGFEFRGGDNSGYYDGDMEPLSPAKTDLTIGKSQAGEYSIYNVSSRTGVAFRRTWAHVRNDKTNTTLFWFVRRGQVVFSHPGGRNVAHPQECALARSSQPFYMVMTPDESGCFEALHIGVPSHKLLAIIGDGVETGRPFPTAKGDLLLAERILTLLFERDAEIDPDTAEQLVQTLVIGVGKTIGRISGGAAPRATIADKRIADITRYINQHFANPDLNAKMVADACGISLRYLCHILKKNELSFSQLLWERRIETAHSWLREDKMRGHAISEIAYLVGFKSSAHFSRMFKARYAVGPREYRNLSEAEVAA